MSNIIDYSEQKMVVDFCNSFFKGKDLSFSVEVPFFDRSIDVVYKDSNYLYAIEFKMFNWKKGIYQAKNHLLGADYIFICLPNKVYRKDLEIELKRNNCGLILFDIETKRSKIVIIPKRNKNTMNRAKDILRKGYEYSLENKTFKLMTSLV
jgi:hypothetical protein